MAKWTQKSRLTCSLSGIAGEYFVAAELSRRGYIASLTLKNTAGIDVLASNVQGTRTVAIQVKTAQNKSREWILGEKAESFHSTSLYYVFVNVTSSGEMPEFYVVPSEVVAAFVKSFHLAALGRGCKDVRMRAFRDVEGQYRDKWDLLELNATEKADS